MDVFVPFDPKDLTVLPECLRAIRIFLRPAATRVFIVGRAMPSHLSPLLQELNVEFLDESTIIPDLPLGAMPQIVGKFGDRTGWYFQQLLKWGFGRLSDGEFYAVVDADCVFIAPVDLREGDKYILYRGNQHNPPYFRTFAKLLGFLPERQPSFIADFMVLDKAMVLEIIGAIERSHPSKPWHRAILDAIDPTELSSFSEYETYGYFLSHFHPDRFVSRRGSGRIAPNKFIGHHHELRAEVAPMGYTSISYHSYLK